MANDDLSSQAPYLVIVAVVAVVAVVTLVMNGSGDGIQGAVSADRNCYEGPSVGNIYELEYVIDDGVRYEDYCVGDNVHQFRCGTPLVKEEAGFIQCPNGCERGACFRPGQNPYT